MIFIAPLIFTFIYNCYLTDTYEHILLNRCNNSKLSYVSHKLKHKLKHSNYNIHTFVKDLYLFTQFYTNCHISLTDLFDNHVWLSGISNQSKRDATWSRHILRLLHTKNWLREGEYINNYCFYNCFLLLGGKFMRI